MNNLEIALLLEKINTLKTKPKGSYKTNTFSVSYRYEIDLGQNYVTSERIFPDIRYPCVPFSYKLHIERKDNGNRNVVQYDGVGPVARAVFEILNAKERGR